MFDVTEIKGLDVKPGRKLAMVAEPIAGDSDVFGALFVVRTDAVSEKDIALIKTAAVILGNSLQKF